MAAITYIITIVDLASRGGQKSVMDVKRLSASLGCLGSLKEQDIEARWKKV